MNFMEEFLEIFDFQIFINKNYFICVTFKNLDFFIFGVFEFTIKLFIVLNIQFVKIY